MTAKNNFYRHADTHICCGYTVRVESQAFVSLGAKWILFILESKCILIHDSRHVQPSNQKTYLSWALHHLRVESQVVVSPGAQWSLFIRESKCILIHDSRHVQPFNQKTYLSWALHKCRVQSSLQVKNYIMLLALISYFPFKFQSTEIPILATLWKKTFPLWRTGVGYVGDLFIPHACLQLGG